MLIYWKTLKKTSFMKKVYRHHFHKTDRKSTRLNSSHSQISYAVFCLKKKKKHATQSTSLRITYHARETCVYFISNQTPARGSTTSSNTMSSATRCEACTRRRVTECM